MSACSTPLITMDKTWARRDTRCPYAKIKLTKPSLNNLLDKFPPPPPHFYDIYLYINIHTYAILRIFIYLDTYFNTVQIPLQ